MSSVLHTHHGAIAAFDSKLADHDAALSKVALQTTTSERQLVEINPKLEKLLDHRNVLEAQGTATKVQSLWDWKTNFTGKIGIVYVAGAAILSMVLKFVGDTVVHFIGHPKP